MYIRRTRENEEHKTPGAVEDLSAYKVIVNTIPATVFTRKNLSTASEGILLIDVASSPGGVDSKYAAEDGISIFNAPGLSGKKAPRTVARAMKEIILEHLENRADGLHVI